MRKWIWGLAVLVAVSAIGFFGIAPGYVEASMNKVDGKPLPKVSAEAIALHKTLTIVDLHSDTLMWKRDMLDRADRGHMDLPRLQEGNVALQVFSSVSKTPKGQNYDANSDKTDNITALAIGQNNHQLNGLSEARFLAHDLFKSWGKVKRMGPYDIVVADPPSYQKGSFVASKDYARLVRRLPELLAPGGQALLCLNAPELPSQFLLDLVASEAPALRFVRRLENPAAFADVDNERALKVMLFEMP